MTFEEFETRAASGEFKFGSSHYGSVCPDTGEVEFDSHGLELFHYASLRDFYNHYILEQPTAHRYCALFATYDEISNQITFLNSDDKERLKGVKIETDGHDIFSDWVEIEATSGYSWRVCIVKYKGVTLNG